MGESGLDCLVIYGAYHYAGNDLGQTNVVYLSNYASIAESYLVFPQNGEPTLIISIPIHIPNAKDISYVQDIRAGTNYAAVISERLNELGLVKGNIGLVGPGRRNVTMPLEHHNFLVERFPKANFTQVTDWYETLRLVKSAEEIHVMERAGALTDLAHEEIFLATRPGIRHTDLRRIIGGVAARHGGTYPFSHVSSTSMENPEGFYPDFYPTHKTVEPGHIMMTEIALGYGNYFGKIWGTYFIGEPTKEYRKLFDLAVSVHDKAIVDLKPGMTGRDVKKYIEPFKQAGCTNYAPLMMGWSIYNHPPCAGAVDGSPAENWIKPTDLDFVFEPGLCVTIIAWPVTPEKKGVWVGTTCVFTTEGLKKLHSYHVNQLRVIPV